MARKREQADVRPDLAAAAARLGSRLRDPGDLTPMAAYLGADETVRFVVLGTYERGSGLLALTDARLVFFHYRVQKPSLDLPLGRISSVTTSAGMSTGEVAVVVGEKTEAVSRIVKADVEPLAHAVRQAVVATPREEAPADPTAPVDPFVAMEKLAALRDSGVLTDEEFAAKKQELLGRL